MKRLLAALALGIALTPPAANADPTSATVNAFTFEQTLDCLTTLAVLRSGGYERDPLAAPFTHSALTEVGAAAVLNLAVRRLPVHILKTMVYIYPVVLLGNMRALGAQSQIAGMVPPTAAAGFSARPRR